MNFVVFCRRLRAWRIECHWQTRIRMLSAATWRNDSGPSESQIRYPGSRCVHKWCLSFCLHLPLEDMCLPWYNSLSLYPMIFWYKNAESFPHEGKLFLLGNSWRRLLNVGQQQMYWVSPNMSPIYVVEFLKGNLTWSRLVLWMHWLTTIFILMILHCSVDLHWRSAVAHSKHPVCVCTSLEDLLLLSFDLLNVY